MSPLIYNAVIASLTSQGYEVTKTAELNSLSKNNEPVCDELLTDKELQQMAIWLEQMRENQFLKMFHFYWQDGRRVTSVGRNVCEAATAAGIGAGALTVMDMYSEGLNPIAVFNPSTKVWIHKSIGLRTAQA